MVQTREESYQQCIRLLGLARTQGEHFDEICRSVFNENLIIQRDAIIALGILNDSRSYFIQASLFLRNGIFGDSAGEIKKSVIYSLQANGDQRGRELLILACKESILEGMAKRALKKLDKKHLIYSYLGDESIRMNAGEYLGKLLETPENLEGLEKFLIERNDFEHPQTYIVDRLGSLRLGFELQEHVQVAGGEKVLAAGEIYFAREQEHVRVEGINNRSNSYFPHESTTRLAVEKLKNVGLRVDEKTVEKFPKEGWLNEEWLGIQMATIFQGFGPEYYHWYQKLFPQN